MSRRGHDRPPGPQARLESLERPSGGGGALTQAQFSDPPFTVTDGVVSLSIIGNPPITTEYAGGFLFIGSTYPATIRAGWEHYGLGLDGAVSITSDTTATTNIYATSASVTTNSRWAMAGFVLHATESVFVEAGSSISANGGNGAAAGTAGTAPAAGAYAPAAGAAGAGAVGAGAAGTNLTAQIGGRGGAGGAGSGGAGGNAGSKTVPGATRGGATCYQVARQHLFGSAFLAGGTGMAAPNNGGGGGGGGGDGAVSGGGGGTGAQSLIICAPAITNLGTIEANGGDGGSPASGNAGGGGPGGGGFVGLVCQTYADQGAGVLRAIYGTPGTGSGTGANGSTATATNGVTATWNP